MSRSSHTSSCSHPDAGGGASHSHPHDHSHGQGGGPGRRAQERQRDRKRLFVTLALTSVIALAEAVGGWWTQSLALLSDAGHMLTDISAIALALLALWFAGKPADVKKTYGYYRLEILSALANGMLLFGITIFIAIEAWQRLWTPTEIAFGPMMAFAAVGLVANLIALAFLHNSHSMSVRGAFLHILGDTLSSVGVLIAGAVMWKTGWLWLDSAVSALIAAIIIVGAFRLVRDAVDVLLEAVPQHVDLTAVRELMGKTSGVIAVHDLHVWTISSGIYALSVHLVVSNALSCNNDEILSAVKHELFDRFGIDHTTIQIESESYAHLGEVH